MGRGRGREIRFSVLVGERGGQHTHLFPKDFSRSSTDFLYSASASSYFPIIIMR